MKKEEWVSKKQDKSTKQNNLLLDKKKKKILQFAKMKQIWDSKKNWKFRLLDTLK
jgi:hypothetical protein